MTFTLEYVGENGNKNYGLEITPTNEISVKLYCRPIINNIQYKLMSAVYHRRCYNRNNGWYDAYVKNSTSSDNWFYYDGRTYEQQSIRQHEIGKMGRSSGENNDAVLCMAVYEKLK